MFFGQGIAGPNLPHLRYITCGPDLAAQAADVHVDEAGVARPHVSPHVLEQLLPLYVRNAVYRGLAAGSETLLTTTGGPLNFNDTGLTNGVAYTCTVTAANTDGASGPSPRPATTPSCSAPKTSSSIS